MTDHGIKVVKTGKGIDSIEPKDYILNSAYSAIKIKSQGSGSVVVTKNSTVTVTIAHGLVFAPLCLYFSELKPGSNIWYPQATEVSQLSSPPESGMDVDSNGATSDATNVLLKFRNYDTVNDVTIDYHCFIFGDTTEA
jgi:hypothetical protein|tara:strand:- start:4200 stop:4613 length:414 start_codon:yes stop_codon:yes gene_type:complete